jgi:hypothetical protein
MNDVSIPRQAAAALALASLLALGLPAAAHAAEEATADPALRAWRAGNVGRVKRNWGIDIVGVKPVSSGYMLAFKYKILDAEKAKLLNERKQKAYLIDEATGTVLAVPAMENIGELRAATTPQVNRTYFMIFGNPGQLVKSGSKVSVVAGDFKIQGLVVE